MKRVALLFPLFSLFLVQAQDLPEGKGKDLVQKICTDCHGVDVIVSQRMDKDGWAGVVDAMVARGAGGTKEELNTIIDYLAKNFAPEKKIEKAHDKSAVATRAGLR